MRKVVNVDDGDIQVSEGYLPEHRARTDKEWDAIRERVDEANAEFDAEQDAERRRKLRILDQIDVLLADAENDANFEPFIRMKRQKLRLAQIRGLRAQLEPPKESIDAKVLREEIQYTMARPDLDLHTKLSAVQALQQYPLRSYIEAPDGISGDLDLYIEIKQYAVARSNDVDKGLL